MKQILFERFVDFVEILPDNLDLLRKLQASSISGANETGHRRLQQVSSRGTWMQCLVVYADIALRASPGRALKHMAYLRMVVHEAQCHSGTGWLLYDTGFRQMAAQ